MTSEKILKVRELPKKQRISHLMTITDVKIPPFLNIKIQVNQDTQEVILYVANGSSYVFQMLDPETDTQDLQLIADTIIGGITKIDWYRSLKEERKA